MVLADFRNYVHMLCLLDFIIITIDSTFSSRGVIHRGSLQCVEMCLGSQACRRIKFSTRENLIYVCEIQTVAGYHTWEIETNERVWGVVSRRSQIEKPKCTGKKPSVLHAKILYSDVVSVEYACAAGYMETRSIASFCKNGRWKTPIGRCKSRPRRESSPCTDECPEVPHSRVHKGDTKVKYTCDTGYSQTAPLYSLCQDGVWTDPEHQCIENPSTTTLPPSTWPSSSTMPSTSTTLPPSTTSSKGAHATIMGKLSPVMSDSSGLAASRRFPGYLYTHNDVHGAPEIYVFDSNNAFHVATFKIRDTLNLDWEDIAVGSCGRDTCIYIGDIGGNKHTLNVIYRVKEPDSLDDQQLTTDAKIVFKWENTHGSTLLVDGQENLFAVMQRKYSSQQNLYKVPLAWGYRTVVKAEYHHSYHIPCDEDEPGYVASLKVYGGDVSRDGNMVVLGVKDALVLMNITGMGVLDAPECVDKANVVFTDMEIKPQGVTFSLDGKYVFMVQERKDDENGHALYRYDTNSLVNA